MKWITSQKPFCFGTSFDRCRCRRLEKSVAVLQNRVVEREDEVIATSS
jgi:hypothetical protein